MYQSTKDTTKTFFLSIADSRQCSNGNNIAHIFTLHGCVAGVLNLIISTCTWALSEQKCLAVSTTVWTTTGRGSGSDLYMLVALILSSIVYRCTLCIKQYWLPKTDWTSQSETSRNQSSHDLNCILSDHIFQLITIGSISWIYLTTGNGVRSFSLPLSHKTTILNEGVKEVTKS